MNRDKLSVLFLQHGKGNTVRLYCRITLNGIRAKSDFTTGISCDPKAWNAAKQQLKNQNEKNAQLRQIEADIRELYLSVKESGVEPSADLLKTKYTEKRPDNSILALADRFIEERKELVNIDISSITLKRYRTDRNHLSDYLESIGRKNLMITEIDTAFAEDFLYWSKTKKKYTHNYIVKHCIGTLKQFLNYAVSRNLLQKNPLQFFRLKQEKPKLPIYLEINELDSLCKEEFTNPSFQRAADLFIFQCHTGFAYADLKQFDYQQHTFINSDNGERWIRIQRQKTDEPSILPLFAPAKRILEKYGNKLPVISNQKYNAYLKIVGDILNFSKTISSHIGRKTFAMIAANSEGVSLDVVSRMLGHADMRMVQQVYARILPKKIAQETKGLFLPPAGDEQKKAPLPSLIAKQGDSFQAITT
jgi:integrase/recombinase XerD